MTKCKCNEIKQLHGREGQEYAEGHLKEITIDLKYGKVLYQCPGTNTYWKEYFQHPEAHGDGPPDFIQISEEEARKEFNF